MQETDMKEKLQKIIEAYDELQAKMGDPAVLADQEGVQPPGGEEYALPRSRSARRRPEYVAANGPSSARRARRCSPTPT